MQLGAEYRGRYIDLSTVGLECAEDVWGLPSGSWLGFHRKATVNAIDHPHHLFAIRLGRWTLSLEFTGVNQAWHCPANAALREQRSRTESEAMSRFFRLGIAPVGD